MYAKTQFFYMIEITFLHKSEQPISKTLQCLGLFDNVLKKVCEEMKC